jgi:hypothetical protein
MLDKSQGNLGKFCVGKSAVWQWRLELLEDNVVEGIQCG